MYMRIKFEMDRVNKIKKQQQQNTRKTRLKTFIFIKIDVSMFQCLGLGINSPLLCAVAKQIILWKYLCNRPEILFLCGLNFEQKVVRVHAVRPQRVDRIGATSRLGGFFNF